MNFLMPTIDARQILLLDTPLMFLGQLKYIKKIIAYSLGNFCTYGRFNLSGPKGFAPILNIEINQSGDFVTGKIIPIKQINRGYVYYDKEKSNK